MKAISTPNKYESNPYGFSSIHKSRNSFTPLGSSPGISTTFDSYSHTLPSKTLNMSEHQMRVQLENKDDDQNFKTLSAIQKIFDKINKRKWIYNKRKRMGTNPLDHSKFKFYSHKVDEATETIKLPQLPTKISRGIDGPKERFYYVETDIQPKELSYQEPKHNNIKRSKIVLDVKKYYYIL